MNENQANRSEDMSTQREGMREIVDRTGEIALAKELSGSGEIFPFPGLNPDAYLKLKTDEDALADYGIPIEIASIDETIRRLADEGMKVVLGKNPETDNIYILPAQSNNIERDSVLPKSLRVVEGMDARLRELILLNRR